MASTLPGIPSRAQLSEQESSSPVVSSAETTDPFCFQHDFSWDNPGMLGDFYKLGKRLGQGTFGNVYQASCLRTGMLRAVKSVQIKTSKGASDLDREISVARQLDHPNVARLYEIFRESAKIHVVMELCSGGELFDKIANSECFDEVQAAAYIRQILAAIGYLHAQHFVHRDVKPENFLLHSSFRGASLKMVDFGLARSFTPGQTMSTKAGTVYYVAPQVVQGSYNEKCDIWSAGVIAYILLCGYPPFNGDSDSEVLSQVAAGEFDFPEQEWEHVSKEAKDFISQMLVWDSAFRASAELLLAQPWLKAKGSAKCTLSDTFLERLQEFQKHTRMKKVALTALARQLPDEETHALRHMFLGLDSNGDGVLSLQEVKQGLIKYGLRIPPTLKEMLQSADSDGSGHLDYSEFVAAMMDKDLCEDREVCRVAFGTFDLDGDGKITQDELCKVVKGGSSTLFGDAGVDNILTEADANGDGEVDFEEFCSLMSTKSTRSPCHYGSLRVSGVLLGREGRTAVHGAGSPLGTTG